MRSTDLFVVGGGPAGLAAAIAARLHGLDVTVADVSTPPIDKTCGEGIMPDGIAAARSLGIHLERAGGETFRGIRFIDRNIAVETPFPHGSGLGLRRTTLHRIMLERAAELGVRFHWGSHVAGLSNRGVIVNGSTVPARWIAGADGLDSRVRRWAGLRPRDCHPRRFGFRRHYRTPPWSDCVEIYWGDGCQLYVTPVAADEVGVALISSDPHLRLADALEHFPEIAQRLGSPVSLERGAVTASRRLRRVYAGNIALIGDASGSVDAITGEGICLALQQAVSLAEALAAGDLDSYQAAHRRLAIRPHFMANLLLLLDRRPSLRHRVMAALSNHPHLFSQLLAMQVGELSPTQFAGTGLSLAWHVLAA